MRICSKYAKDAKIEYACLFACLLLRDVDCEWHGMAHALSRCFSLFGLGAKDCKEGRG
jgi:hypothetical protein